MANISLCNMNIENEDMAKIAYRKFIDNYKKIIINHNYIPQLQPITTHFYLTFNIFSFCRNFKLFYKLTNVNELIERNNKTLIPLIPLMPFKDVQDLISFYRIYLNKFDKFY